MAACLSLTAIVQLNGRSIFAVGEAQGKDGAFATLVQPEPKGVAGGIAPARGIINRLLDSAGRGAGKPAAQPAGDGATSSGTTPQLATVAAPATVPTAPDGTTGMETAGSGPQAVPPFKGLLSQLAPISGPAGFIPRPGETPTGPTTEPTPPTDGPTPPVTEPTTPVTGPTPVSPVPEPATWAMLLIGFGTMGGLIRWRRRALHAAATEGVGGGAA